MEKNTHESDPGKSLTRGPRPSRWALALLMHSRGRHLRAQSGLDPHSLKLELTESAMMRDPAASLEIMKTFRAMDIHLVVDDFGTGYSSLSYLKRFPVDTLKVDKSFVDGLGKDPESTAIVTAILSLARSLGMKVIAEGIETQEQMTYLQGLNCDQGQGYHFSRPLSVETAEAILAQNPLW